MSMNAEPKVRHTSWIRWYVGVLLVNALLVLIFWILTRMFNHVAG